MYKLNNVVEKIKLAREGSDVSRAHTIRHHGEYNVGQHSFNMLIILRILRPDAPTSLIWAILEHDIPERLIGDIPAPAKWFGVIDRDATNLIEMEINEKIFGKHSVQSLSENDLRWLNGLDILELYMWCRDQIRLGNAGVENMKRRIEHFVKGNQQLFADQVVNLFFETKLDSWYHMPDLGDRHESE